MKVHKGEELTIYGQTAEWTCVECGKPAPTDFLSYCSTCNESHCTSCLKVKLVTKTTFLLGILLFLQHIQNYN